MRRLGRHLRPRRSRPPRTSGEPARHLDADLRLCSQIKLGVCFHTMVKWAPVYTIKRHSRRMAAEAPRPFRHLSPSIAAKRSFPAVDLTVSFACPEKKSRSFSCLYGPETI